MAIEGMRTQLSIHNVTTLCIPSGRKCIVFALNFKIVIVMWLHCIYRACEYPNVHVC